MEDAKKLGDMALKLERYRYNIVSALGWVIFGMLFGSMTILYSSLLLFGIREYWIIGILMIAAGITGGYTYGRFWKFIPVEREVKRRWYVGVILLSIPFIVSYLMLPFLIEDFLNSSAFYFSTAWYPSLGFGLLFNSIYSERKDKHLVTKTMSYAGILIILTSTIFLLIPTLGNAVTAIAAGLLGVSMMILIYLLCALYTFFKAQRVIYS